MKLLIPTDFSDTSRHAIQVGHIIAKKTASSICLFHAIEWIGKSSQMDVTDQQLQELIAQSKSSVTAQLEALAKELEESGITVTFQIGQGKFITTLTEITDTQKFDLILIGSRGLSENDRGTMGSNAIKAVRKLRSKILIVKEPMEQFNFSEVVFVTGLHQEDLNAFRHFLDFVKRFDVKEVHVMSVDTKSFFSQPTYIMKTALQEFAKQSSVMNIETHFYHDTSILSGIDHFKNEYNIDLIGISNHVKHPIKRFFAGSTVEMVVGFSDIPVLCIDY